MRNRFDRQLLKLNQEMIDMGSLCEEMITAAAKIVATRDKELMDDIVTMEEEINQKERDIERICMKLLMQQQPVASDLRVISAAMKMVSDMESLKKMQKFLRSERTHILIRWQKLRSVW